MPGTYRGTKNFPAAGSRREPLICLIVLLASRCTKEDGNGVNPPGTGTPKGTYTISVEGNSGSLTASTSVTLIVN